MENIIIPCETCISFAICYQRKVIRCKDLYDFVCITNPLGGFCGYKDGVAEQIYELYRKYISATYYSQNTIYLRKNIDPNNYLSPFHEQRLYKYINDFKENFYSEGHETL